MAYKPRLVIYGSRLVFVDRQAWAGPEVGTGVKNHKNVGFLSNTSLDPLKKYKATKPAFNIGPSSARRRDVILIAFHWRADDGPLIVVFGSSHQLKEIVVKAGPPLTKLSGSAHGRLRRALLGRKN